MTPTSWNNLIVRSRILTFSTSASSQNTRLSRNLSKSSDSSVIFRSLKDPAVDSVLQAARNCFVPEGHLNFGLARYQYEQIALIRFAGNHHRSEFGTLHQTIIARQIETASGVALAAGLVARFTIAFENRRDVFAETHGSTLPLRAGIVDWRHDCRRC